MKTPSLNFPHLACLVAGLWLACLGQPVVAATAVAEVLAKDMREEVLRTRVTVKDLNGRQETQDLPITVYRPPGEGPFPLLVYNHGRAVKAKRAAQGRSRPEHAARYWVGKGFVVMAPTRVGYWETYGDFDPEQSGSCNNPRIEPMSIAASDQVLATVEFAKKLPYVDTSRWIVAGQSVGGLTAVATVGRNPPGLLGGINFSGGTGGNPEANPEEPCNPKAIASYWASIAKNARAPMLWMYWGNDQYWGEEYPKQWHRAWVDGGGKATFAGFDASGEDGHNGINADMDTWLPVVDKFLTRLGFGKKAIVVAPPASGFADIEDASSVPIDAQGRANGYAKFLKADAPRAFAVGDKGGWGYATGDYVTGRAVGFCQRFGQTCKLYAVDDDVVWTGR